MSRNSQKRAGRILALISIVLLIALAALTALRISARFPNAEHVNTNVLPSIDAVAALVALGVVALSAALYFAFGRPTQPMFRDSTWRTVPGGGMHPAIFGRLCRWKRQNSTDLAATIIRLAQKGAIRVERGTRTDARGKEVSDYLLTREQMTNAQPHAIDDASMKMIFDIVGKGESSIWLGEIHSFGRHHADAFSSAMRTWQSTVAREVKRSGCFAPASEKAHVALLGLTVVSALAGLLAALGTHSAVPVICGVVAGAAAWIAARQMPQHTPAGADAYAQGKALHAWLRSVDDEASSSRAAFPSELIAYAYVLREMGAACVAYPGLAEFCDELTVCIGSTAFAAESTVAYESLRALNSPVRAATLSHGGVTGLSNPPEDSEDLFSRRA